MEKEFNITNDKSYRELLSEVYHLMQQNKSGLTSTGLKKLSKMTIAIEKYEDNVLKLKPVKE